MTALVELARLLGLPDGLTGLILRQLSERQEGEDLCIHSIVLHTQLAYDDIINHLTLMSYRKLIKLSDAKNFIALNIPEIRRCATSCLSIPTLTAAQRRILLKLTKLQNHSEATEAISNVGPGHSQTSLLKPR